MNGPHDRPDADSLDALLHAADRCELESERLERLSQQWSKINRDRRRTRHLALAAGLLVSVGGFVAYQKSSEVRQAEQIAEQSSDGTHADRSDQKMTAGANGETRAPRGVNDALHQLVTVAVVRRIEQERRLETLAAERTEPGDDDEVTPEQRLETAIASLAAGGSVEEALDELKQTMSTDQLLTMLLMRLEQPVTEPNAEAIWKLVTASATPASLPSLERLRRHARWKERSERLMATLVDSPTLLHVAQRESSFQSRRILAAELLSRGDAESVRAYLALVNHAQVSPAALDAVADVSEVPVRALMTCLDARQREVRIAAALTLGRSNRDEVVLELIHRASYPATRKVALVALVASDHPIAKQYVFQAASDVRQTASLQAARHLVHLFSTNS